MLSGWKGAVNLVHPISAQSLFLSHLILVRESFTVFLHFLIATSSMNLVWFLESWWCEKDVYCVRLKQTIILRLWWAAELILPGSTPRSFVLSLVLTVSLIIVAIITGLIVVKLKGILTRVLHQLSLILMQ